MQTFLPYSSYKRSAAVLDLARLGKQIIEAGQILRAIAPPRSISTSAQNVNHKAWGSHPALLQWQDYADSLMIYTYACTREWKKRRGKIHGSWSRTWDEQHSRWLRLLSTPPDEVEKPAWLGDLRFHLSHQSNLYRKDPVLYGPIFPAIANDPELQNLEYFWPSKEGY